MGLVRPVLEYSQAVWDPYTVSDTQQIESVQHWAARFTMNRYRRTSSVGAMLAELNWESLASRRRTARLMLFHKIHYGLVAINMSLEFKYNSGPTWTENSLAYHIPASSADYQKNSFFSTVQSETGTVFLMKLFIHRSLSISVITFYHKLRLRYSTDFGERESRPFHEEPEILLYFN